MAAIMRSFLLLAALTAPCGAVEERAAANPIRKVVTMLQMMQKKVEAEGEKGQDMHDKFMCYCKNGVGALEKSIAEAETKSGELPSQIEEAVGELKQLKEDLKKAQVDRASAKTAIEEATAIRAKEASAFATESGELKTNIAAIGKAVAALEKGMGGAFLQTSAAATLKNLVENDQKMLDVDREEILAFAKNRLNKFYNPKLYKAPPKRELSEEDRITLNMGGSLAPTAAPGGIAGTGIGFAQRVAPGPPPETAKAYSKKSGESGGVIAMIDALVKELDMEMTEAETNEKNDQEEYEELMADSAEKRAADSKSLAQKEGQKADTEAALVDFESESTSTAKALMATIEYIGQLHGECDWLIKYFDIRKEARTGEIDALGKAKAVLNGADYSLMQTKSHTFLRRA